MKPIKIGYLSTAHHTSFILMGTGWIQERMNTRTQWRLFPTGPEMIRAFAKDELDIGYIGLPPAMIGIDRGLGIRCVAGGHMEGTVFTAKKNYKTFTETGSVERTLKQFKGKTIGTPTKGSIHDVIIRNLLDKFAFERDITVRNFSWADQILEAMEDNEVDGGVGTPPLTVLASRLLGARMMMPPHLMWPHNPSYGIVATLDLIESSRSLIEGFLKLHEQACNMIRGEPQRAAEIAAKTLGLIDKDFVSEVYLVSPKYCASLPKEYVDSTLTFLPFLRKMGYVSKPLLAKDVFYRDIIESVHHEEPHYDNAGMLR